MFVDSWVGCYCLFTFGLVFSSFLVDFVVVFNVSSGLWFVCNLLVWLSWVLFDVFAVWLLFDIWCCCL